jgi:toxin ParE1/3/4
MRDIATILELSEREFGQTAALRYETLIAKALEDIGNDPERPGSIERPELMIHGARTYHLAFSRSRVKGQRVKAPRHFLLYRSTEEHVIEIWRILHDRRDVARHLPEEYRH